MTNAVAPQDLYPHPLVILRQNITIRSEFVVAAALLSFPYRRSSFPGSSQRACLTRTIPGGLAIRSAFAMVVIFGLIFDGSLMARAANIYQSIVSRRRDPAILEQ